MLLNISWFLPLLFSIIHWCWHIESDYFLSFFFVFFLAFFGCRSRQGIYTNTKKSIHINPHWHNREITLDDGRKLSYEFGKWNPKGADLLTTKEIASYKNCLFSNEQPSFSCLYGGKKVTGHVTPDVEYDLFQLLSLPQWKDVIRSCEHVFLTADAQRRLQGDKSIHYDIIYGWTLDINRLLVVDTKTGRKKLSLADKADLEWWFMSAYFLVEDHTKLSSYRLNDKKRIQPHPCLSWHGGDEILMYLDFINEKHLRPLWNYPERISSKNKYIPWHKIPWGGLNMSE